MKRLICIITLVFLTFSGHSQDKDRKDKIKALKIAFITGRLQFTETEAQQFWPIYNTYEESEHKLREASHKNRKDLDFEKLSEAEAKNLVNNMLKIEEDKFQLRKKFITDLQKVLPAKKIVLLKATEDAFNKRMFEQYKKRKEQHKQ